MEILLFHTYFGTSPNRCGRELAEANFVLVSRLSSFDGTGISRGNRLFRWVLLIPKHGLISGAANSPTESGSHPFCLLKNFTLKVTPVLQSIRHLDWGLTALFLFLLEFSPSRLDHFYLKTFILIVLIDSHNTSMGSSGEIQWINTKITKAFQLAPNGSSLSFIRYILRWNRLSLKEKKKKKMAISIKQFQDNPELQLDVNRNHVRSSTMISGVN